MTDRTDLAHASETRGGLPAVSDSAGMLAMVVSGSHDPTVNADKMVTLANLAIQLQDRERQATFSASKVAAIAEIPAIFKRGASDKHKYAKWEDMHRRVMPILNRNGLTLTHAIGQSGNMITIEAVLEHTNGVKLFGGALPLPIDNSGSKNAVQGVASTVAYGKRITGKAILNIIESEFPEDDDGNAAGPGLEPMEQALLDEAEEAANGGPTTYMDWFKGKSADAKGWMVFKGHHDRLKTKAMNL